MRMEPTSDSQIKWVNEELVEIDEHPVERQLGITQDQKQIIVRFTGKMKAPAKKVERALAALVQQDSGGIIDLSRDVIDRSPYAGIKVQKWYMTRLGNQAIEIMWGAPDGADHFIIQLRADIGVPQDKLEQALIALSSNHALKPAPAKGSPIQQVTSPAPTVIVPSNDAVAESPFARKLADQVKKTDPKSPTEKKSPSPQRKLTPASRLQMLNRGLAEQGIQYHPDTNSFIPSDRILRDAAAMDGRREKLQRYIADTLPGDMENQARQKRVDHLTGIFESLLAAGKPLPIDSDNEIIKDAAAKATVRNWHKRVADTKKDKKEPELG